MDTWVKLVHENVKPDYYFVNSDGRIKNIMNKEIKPELSNAGYYRVNLAIVDEFGTPKQKHFQVHRLVAIAFLDAVEDKKIINHKDGNKVNNKLENLEWCTYSENLSHAFQTNLRSQNGESNPSVVYTESLVREICSIIDENQDNIFIMTKLKMENTRACRSLINHIRKGTRWKSVSKDFVFGRTFND